MRARMVGAFVVAALVWWAGGAVVVDARCQVAQLGPRMLTPITAALPRDGGGVVVGLVNGSTGGAMPAGVQLTRGRRSQELVAQELAPGLVRFAPTARLLPGAWSAPKLKPRKTGLAYLTALLTRCGKPTPSAV